MSRDTGQLPKLVTLTWGFDLIHIEDPTWIAKIVQEVAKDCHPEDDYYSWARLPEPRSLRDERIEAQMQAAFGHTPDCEGHETYDNLTGYHPPHDQSPVAAEALRKFIGVQMPIALNFNSRRGRSEHRLSAVHAKFEVCRSYSFQDQLKLCWSFSGYQLYANHDVGTGHLRRYWTDTSGFIERRRLNGRWVRLGFGGASPRDCDDTHFYGARLYILANNEVHELPRVSAGFDNNYDRIFLDDIEGNDIYSEEDL